jgi:hypothetical protein
VTKNEILYSLNKPEDFILAIVEFLTDDTSRVHYVRRPFQREPDFGVTSVNYDSGERACDGASVIVPVPRYGGSSSTTCRSAARGPARTKPHAGGWRTTERFTT